MSQKISQYFDYKIAGKDYKIRFKTPKVRDQLTIGQTFAALKAGFERLDTQSENLAYAIATLNIVIVDKPADLDLDDLDPSDWGVLNDMVKDYQQFAFFRDKSQEQSVKA